MFSDLVSLQYVRPEVGGDILFGNSDLSDVEEADPDNYLNRATEAFVDLTVDKVGTRFPGFADAAISSSYAGCYDVTPDWNPVISTTGLDGLVVAAGFSGHGFKIAPAVGRLVADLVVDGHSDDPRIPQSDFRLSRFAEGDLLKSAVPVRRCRADALDRRRSDRRPAASQQVRHGPRPGSRTSPSRSSSSRPRSAATCGSCGNSTASPSRKWLPALAFPRR